MRASHFRLTTEETGDEGEIVNWSEVCLRLVCDLILVFFDWQLGSLKCRQLKARCKTGALNSRSEKHCVRNDTLDQFAIHKASIPY